MKTIRQDIKNKSFKNIYLLYGEDDYMLKLYKNKLKTALLEGSDDINLNIFTSDNHDIEKIKTAANTVPFFFDKRLIILDNTNLLKESNELGDYITTAPDFTYFVFVEKAIDKRNKLYKAIAKQGHVVEMNGLTEYELTAFIKAEIAKYSLAISDADASYMLNKIGSDMNTIVNECAKVASYSASKEIVEKSDIDTICITLLENKIFEMLDYIANGHQTKALLLYNNLIALKESPAKILYLITRHFNILYKLSLGKKSGVTDKDLCSDLKIPPFALKKYNAQLSHFSTEQLMNAVNDCLDIEESFKTGKLNEQIGIEILILKFSRNL